MTIYILNILLILFWALICFGNENTKMPKIFLMITGIQLFAISGLRGSSVGTDTFSYLQIYNNFLLFDTINYTRLEPGYKFLMVIASFISENPQLILIFTTFIIIFFIFIGIYHTSSSIWLSVFLFIALYYFYNSFNGIRQYIAIAFVFYGYQFLLKKQFKKYLICILIAVSFHTTALITLPLYFLGKMKLTLSTLVVLIFSIILVSLSLDKIIQIVTQYVPKYAGYLDSMYLTESGGIMSSVVTGSFVLLGLYVYLTEKVNRQFEIEFTIIIIALILSLTSMYGYIGLNRIAWYLTIYSIIFIPNSINLIRSKQKKLFLTFIIILVGLAYNLYFLYHNQQKIIPYIFN